MGYPPVRVGHERNISREKIGLGTRLILILPSKGIQGTHVFSKILRIWFIPSFLSIFSIFVSYTKIVLDFEREPSQFLRVFWPSRSFLDSQIKARMTADILTFRNFVPRSVFRVLLWKKSFEKSKEQLQSFNWQIPKTAVFRRSMWNMYVFYEFFFLTSFAPFCVESLILFRYSTHSIGAWNS